jgi:uncharacterized protein YidB (DUF937 family)
MFARGGWHSAGGDNGFTRRTERHAKWPARPQHAERPRQQQRNVADDHGDPCIARLQGGETANAGPSGGGGLGSLIPGGLGGLLAGGAAGSVISGGLGDLLKQFQQNGHGETANSWVSPGPNKQIAPGDLANALGADQINSLMSQSGLSREDLLSGLSQHLPEVVNHLTPDGRLPTEDELSDRL